VADMMEGENAKLPPEFLNGTATLEQIKTWIAAENSYLPGQPTWELEEQDLDLDGVYDLLISDTRLGGSGGNPYIAFIRTPAGYRCIGCFLGSIRTLPLEAGHLPRLVTSSAMGSSTSEIQLLELRPHGLYLLASAELAAGDGGTEEGNRDWNELFESKTVSTETLRKIFGQGTL
jgi:hypothetical protein